jgi:hypothetical protein
VVIVFALYEIFTIAINLVMTGSTIQANSTDVLSVLGQDVWAGVGGLAIGLIPLAVYWMLGSPYFKQRPTLGSVLPEDTALPQGAVRPGDAG